jgi:membrane protease YdiL (CAAX protease family)
MLGALILQIFSTLFCKQVLGLEQTEQQAVQAFTQCKKFAPLALPIFIAVATLGAPFMEEIIFRGLLYAGLRGRMHWMSAALISSAIFAAIHFDPWQFVGLFGLGFAFAWVREKTGSLLLAMLLHASNNIFTVTIMLILPDAK